ncbi:hypothetical protein CF319_g3301 [Tilletia indica]|nr:hypothetical protein CF319_g3301 [Tilletia indica]
MKAIGSTWARSLGLWALIAIALNAYPAQASLLDSKSPVFKALGDMTRPDGQKLANDAKTVVGQSSGGPTDAYAHGVQWTAVKTPEVRLLDGTLNQGTFAIKTTGADGKGVDKTSSNYGELVKQSLASMDQEMSSKASSAKSNMDSLADSKTHKSSMTAKAGSFSPLNPSSIPLLVRGPYLNAWLPSGSLSSAQPPNKEGNGGFLAGQLPTFWTGGRAEGDFRLGLYGYIRIDGVSYQFMGNGFGNLVPAGSNAEQLSMEYTSTRTIFKFSAAGVGFTVTFLTPITPTDYLRQSIPASYIHFELDDPSAAKRKKIQLYVDVDERWATGHDHDFDNFPVKADIFRTNGTFQYAISRTQPEVLTEFRDRAEWGSFVFAAEKKPGLTTSNGNNQKTQQLFLDNGALQNRHGPALGPDNSFAFALDLNAEGSGSDIVFTLGHFRSPYVTYVRAAHPGTSSPGSYDEKRYGFWQSKFTNLTDAMAFFTKDFSTAAASSVAFDLKVAGDSRAAAGGGTIGDQYAAITSLSIRQALSALEITVPQNEDGSFPTNNPMMFLKEIQSSGRVQTVDVIFPLHVLLTYLNPDLLPMALDPIFEYSKSGLYPNPWCVHDLGGFPKAEGYPKGDDLAMQVEESGNMIIMALHWAKLVGAKTAAPYLRKNYQILSQWSHFLVNDSLIPATQLSTDDFAGTAPNQTSLALKGLVGIGAMAAIADIVGQAQDAAIFRNISASFVPVWKYLATAQNGQHLKLVYGDDNSWGTLYNLLADRLLNLQLIPKSIYTMQDAYYPEVRNAYGVPLDSRFNWAKTDWMMFTAAAAESTKTRDIFIQDLYKFANDRFVDVPFPDLIETTSGDMPKPPFDFAVSFFSRPVVGGHFALLAKMLADKANGVTQYKFGPEPNTTSFTDVEIMDVLHRGKALATGLSANQK